MSKAKDFPFEFLRLLLSIYITYSLLLLVTLLFMFVTNQVFQALPPMSSNLRAGQRYEGYCAIGNRHRCLPRGER